MTNKELRGSDGREMVSKSEGYPHFFLTVLLKGDRAAKGDWGAEDRKLYDVC